MNDEQINTADNSAIDRHALRMLLERNSLASIMHVAVAFLLAGVMSTAVPVWRGIFFAVSLTAVLIFQIRLTRHAKADWSDATFLELRRRFDVSAIGVGSLWAFAAFFLFPSGEPAKQLFLTFVIGGMSLSAVGTQGMRLRTCYFSIVAALTAHGIRYMLEGGVDAIISGSLILAYLSVLIALARKINDFMLQAFRLQMEKDELLEERRLQANELVEARKTAEEANLAKSRFLAQASHDLRQPLHAINLLVESLPETNTIEERDAILDRVRQSLDVLTKLFDSLLDVTLLDTGGIEVQEENFRSSDLVDEVLQDFTLIASACRVDIKALPSSLAISSDPVLVRRMLQNLVSNAIRHSEGGRVRIGCKRRNGKLSLQVIDTGSGIDASDQERIFGEFTRLDKVRMGESATPGLGLGLSIVKRIAEELGLSVRLDSTPGRGSTFSIDGFDIARFAPQRKPEILAKSAVVQGASVFVLDDDPETLAATKLLLGRWGCIVEVSQDWRILLDASPDVIICDYELSPELNGLDVLANLREKNGKHAPVIMISGHTSAKLRDAAANESIPLLHKPIRPAQLRSALLNVLTLSHKSA